MLLAFAALVLWLRYDALPHVDRHRELIVSSIEMASGMDVSVRSIRGGWGGLRPVLSLEGLTIADRQGKAAFELARADVSLSWWSLLRGEVRFHDVDFYRPTLELRRGADGLVYLADKPINEPGPSRDGAFIEWLLTQPRLAIHDAALTWRDDFLAVPEVRLTDVQIAVQRHRGRHRAALSAVPPRALAGRIEVRADVALTREGDGWRARGQAYAESLNADLGRLRAHLPVPETLRSGVGSLRVWSRFSPAGVDEVVADLRLADARAQLAADALPLELASISGRATYRAQGGGFVFSTEGLRFRLSSGMEAQPGRFTLVRAIEQGEPPRLEVHADGIDLKIAATLVDYFPVPREVKSQVLRFAPRGRIADAVIAWSDDGEKTYSVRGRFEDLAVNKVDAIPGVSGLTGEIEGSEAGGTVRLAGRDARLDFGPVFREPLGFDTLELRAHWKRVDAALEVHIDAARFANADAAGELAGSWRSAPGTNPKSPGLVSLRGSLARAAASRVAHYMPRPTAAVRAWLEQAILAGQGSAVKFELEGDLWEFPFGGASKGRFLVAGDLSGGRLRYHPAWPSVDAIDGSFRFENRRMEIRATRAAIFASRVDSVVAVIDDLSALPPVLSIDGEVDTSGADGVRFLRESPLVEGPGAFTRAVAVEGPGRLLLKLTYPLWGPDPVRVAGDYRFDGATARVSPSLAMRDVRGRLAFSERGVSAPALAGTLFGMPATLSMATEADGRILTNLEGRIDAAALREYVPAALATRLSGATAWKARVLSSAQATDLVLESELEGLAVALPAPLGKDAEQARASTLAVSNLRGERESATVALAGGVHGRFQRVGDPGGERWNAALHFGAPPGGEPLREGLWLYGKLAALDVDAWQAVFAAPPGQGGEVAATSEGAQGLELRGMNLDLGRVRYGGREFHDLAARLERRGAQWSGELESPLLAGTVAWNPEGQGRLVAKLSRLAIPEPAPATAEPQPVAKPADLPAIDVMAERFDFRGRTLGRLELKAQPAGAEWRIERLDIDAGHSTFASRGVWRSAAEGSTTTLDVRLDANDLNALLGLFGYGDYLKRGSGQLHGSLAWPGQPHEFSFAQLSGELKVEARRGQFAKFEPGAGKLLGLLSLQSLPRRAVFDFRDVFSEGFAFERIEGGVKVASGVLLTDDFEISGPSAFVSLAGEVSLPRETQSLTLRVVPEVGEGMALAATVFGTPVLGLSTLLVSKLLRNPLGKVVAYEYLVTGSWDNPVLTRTSAPAAKAATSE